MDQLIILNLGHGNWQQGFPLVTAQIWAADRATPIKVIGQLDSNLALPTLYQRWQTLYQALHQSLGLRRSHPTLDLEIDEDDITQVSVAEFQDLSEQLKREVNQWLSSDGFGKIERQLRTQLQPQDTVRLILETEDPQLRRLPWHLWSFFEDYPHAEVGLSTLEYGRVTPVDRPAGPVRILAILGSSVGIQVEQDRALLAALSQTECVFLVEPDRPELNRWLWDERGWDIVFFAGHSTSHNADTTGFLEINATDRLSIAQLRHALKAAIARGLQLAIFNSCEGLGLARALADLSIPQLVVMREPVPDGVATTFLQHFLASFSNGTPFYLAVREAREKLQGLESQFPGASWLPVICQNSTVEPPTWQALQGIVPATPTVPSPPGPPEKSQRLGLRLILSVSLILTSVLVGVRSLGLLQPSELRAFDHLMQLRPPEAPDPRLLIITVGEPDIQYQDQQQMVRQGSLSDQALERLITILEPHQPHVIGLDIYHDFEFSPTLQRQLAQMPHFIAACEVGLTADVPTSVAAPPDFAPEHLGFTDFPRDPDDVMRRHLLGMSSSPECPTSMALSLQIANAYLEQTGAPPLERTEDGTVRIGPVLFPRLEHNSGGYQLRPADVGGYQILLNYRAAALQQVSLTDVLSGAVTQQLPEWVQNRIVLIGVASRDRDAHLTPTDRHPHPDKLPGVIIHGHMASQILSTVLDDRPLLWWWPQWGEVLWIGGWSLMGGLLVWGVRSPLKVSIGVLIGLGGLYGVCWMLFLQGGWIPLIPAAWALGLTTSSLMAYRAIAPYLRKG